MSEWTIGYFMRKNGWQLDRWRLENRVELYGAEVVDMYLDEYTLGEISEELGISNKIISRILAYLHIPKRSREQVKAIGDKKNHYRKHQMNFDYFKEWTPNSAYIIGFIMADGTISKGNMTIQLSSVDKDILEKIKKEVEYTGEVRLHNSFTKGAVREFAILQLSSWDIVEDLFDKGVYENKTFTVEMPEDIPNELIIHFIRGYFDGDGTVGAQYPTNSKGVQTKMIQIRVRIASGSKKIMTQMRDWLYENIGVRNVKVNKIGENLYEIAYSTKDSMKLHKSFYSDGVDLYLDRKKNRFDELVSLRKIDENKRRMIVNGN